MSEVNFRDRVKELRRVKASELVPHESNWRTHGEGQRAALEGLLGSVGFAGACLAYVREDGRLGVIDGHLRRDVSGDATVPVLVTDLSEAEALEVLATYDPVGALAGADAQKLEELLAQVEPSSEAVARMLEDLAAQAGIAGGDAPAPPDDFPAYDESIPTEHTCPKCGFQWSGGEP